MVAIKADALNARVDRFRLQSVSRGLLPEHRVAKCYRVRVKEFVAVNFAQEKKYSFYSGLCICGSVWACPVCASKISERRKNELENTDFSKYFLYLVTVTISHKKEDTLKNLVVALGQAWRSVRSGRWYKKLQSDFGLVGSITAQELTWGIDTGFHPHKHILFLSTKKNIDTEKFKTLLFSRYSSNLLKRGRHASFEHGIKVQSVDGGITDYISKVQKWHIEAELTKGTVKRSRVSERLQMFDLLDNDSPFIQSKFIEYVSVYQGARQLVYSAGLRDLLKMDEDITDEELAEADIKDDHIILASLSADDWKIVLKKKKRGELLEVARYGDSGLLKQWLGDLYNG